MRFRFCLGSADQLPRGFEPDFLLLHREGVLNIICKRDEIWFAFLTHLLNSIFLLQQIGAVAGEAIIRALGSLISRFL